MQLQNFVNILKILSYLKSAFSNLCCCKVWCKNTLIWEYLEWNLKIISLYSKSASSNLPNCKILLKKQKFWIKNPLFGCFRARILKIYCHIRNQQPQICLIVKFCEKKSLNLGPKLPYLGTFGIEFEKNIVEFEKGTLKFVKNESLTHTVNFGIGSAFSQVCLF